MTRRSWGYREDRLGETRAVGIMYTLGCPGLTVREETGSTFFGLAAKGGLCVYERHDTPEGVALHVLDNPNGMWKPLVRNITAVQLEELAKELLHAAEQMREHEKNQLTELKDRLAVLRERSLRARWETTRLLAEAENVDKAWDAAVQELRSKTDTETADQILIEINRQVTSLD